MSSYAKPLPEPDLDTLPFWQGCKAHEVRAQRCRACRHFRWPPQVICPHCYSFDHDWVALPPTGTLYSYAVVHHVTVPAFAVDVPYINARATIDGTESRVIIPGILVDCRPDAVIVGMPLRVFFEDVTDAFSLPRFRAAG